MQPHPNAVQQKNLKMHCNGRNYAKLDKSVISEEFLSNLRLLKLVADHFIIVWLSGRKPPRNWMKGQEGANCALMHLFFCS